MTPAFPEQCEERTTLARKLRRCESSSSRGCTVSESRIVKKILGSTGSFRVIVAEAQPTEFNSSTMLRCSPSAIGSEPDGDA
jgi:hypothetical protein